jgi:hypothetical protein
MKPRELTDRAVDSVCLCLIHVIEEAEVGFNGADHFARQKSLRVRGQDRLAAEDNDIRLFDDLRSRPQKML